MAFLIDEAGAQLSKVPEEALQHAVDIASVSCDPQDVVALAWRHARGCQLACEWITFMRVLARGNLEAVQWLHARAVLTPRAIRQCGGGSGGGGGTMLEVAAGGSCMRGADGVDGGAGLPGAG